MLEETHGKIRKTILTVGEQIYFMKQLRELFWENIGLIRLDCADRAQPGGQYCGLYIQKRPKVDIPPMWYQIRDI